MRLQYITYGAFSMQLSNYLSSILYSSQQYPSPNSFFYNLGSRAPKLCLFIGRQHHLAFEVPTDEIGREAECREPKIL